MKSRQVPQLTSFLLGASFLFGFHSLARADESDWFIDTSGERQEFMPAHVELNAPVGEPHVLRAVLESAGAIGLGTAWYWLDSKTNRVDWDNPQFEERLSGNAWRFDNNDFGINFLAHPGTGSGLYVLARTNDLGPAWSFANSFGFSLLWELGIEFKEKVSINDQLVTPLAGLSVGEFAYRMGRWTNSLNSPTAFQHVLRYSLGLGESMHRAWDGIPPEAKGAIDRQGYATGMWHQFSLGYGVTTASSSPTLHSYRFSGEFAAVPGYRQPGRADTWFHQLEFSELEFEHLHSTNGTRIDLDSEVIVAGHYHHEMWDESDSTIDGFSSILGTHVGYGYRSGDARGFDERYAPLRLPGLAGRLWFAEGAARLTLNARANLEFAGVAAHAYDDWLSSQSDPERGKTVLRKQGYFYGFGPSYRLDVELSLGGVQLYASAAGASVHSTEGFDRSQELISEDERAHTKFLEWEAGVRGRIPKTPLVVSAGFEKASWNSWVEGFSTTNDVWQQELGLDVLF